MTLYQPKDDHSQSRAAAIEGRPERDPDDMEAPMICPITSQPCMTEQDEFCEDYGCVRKAGIDVDGDLIA